MTSVKTHDNIDEDSLIRYVFTEVFNEGGPFNFCKNDGRQINKKNMGILFS
ncbi:hypothetical protein J6TS2_06960 [Heyndrickxia sporothermodurans]|nr:hypothetical protein J6TS2_06960 [Heyndrickxia sporothermodurans]